MAIGRPEAIDGAPRRGLTAKEGFLGSRGMTAQPAGEESLTALLRHRRSRLQPAFGQIRPLKRPFGAVETRSEDGEHGDHLHRQTGGDRGSTAFRFLLQATRVASSSVPDTRAIDEIVTPGLRSALEAVELLASALVRTAATRVQRRTSRHSPSATASDDVEKSSQRRSDPQQGR